MILNTISQPIITEFVKKIITPKLDSFIKSCKLKYNELLIPKSEHFQEYLYRTYNKYSIINTLVFKNEQRLLKDIYIPLTICKNALNKQDSEKETINGYPTHLMTKYNKILITDTAGMGKSTLTKRIYLDIIEQGYGIPIYIEMRRLNSKRPILDEIREQISALNKDFDLDLLYLFIQTGGFIFILDGYDEISLRDRRFVTSNIQDFISKAGNNIFILTSRPEDSLACFGDFQRFKINSLTQTEAYELLRKYDTQGEISQLLISELETRKYKMIDEFLKNPLLVSLLFAAFEYKQTIPLKKHIFYRQVYDAYFDSHDLSKGDGYIHEKLSGLDIDDFDRVLRHVGYRCLKCQKIEFDKDSLLKIIEEAKKDCIDINFAPSDFLHDLLNSVPLFCNDGQYYKWVHKSIQEYFAAQFIYKDAKENQDKILLALYNSSNLDKYLNLLDIYYDIDNWGFTKNITKSICEEYCNFYEQNLYKSPIIESNEIEDRIGYLFLREVCILKRGAISSPFTTRYTPYLSQEATMIEFFDTSSIVVASYLPPKFHLLSLIHDKNNHLFKKQTEHEFIEDNIPWGWKSIYKIDIHSFENNNSFYKIINQYLWGRGDILNTLNYHACKEEINKINYTLEKKQCSSSIIDGL